MKRFAVFSDIHGNLPALKAILSDIDRNKFDEIICLGDVIGIGPEPKECLNLIRNSNVKLILGNHEIYFLSGIGARTYIPKADFPHQAWVKKQLNMRDSEFLKGLPFEYVVRENDFSVCFFHFFLKENLDESFPYLKTDLWRQKFFAPLIKNFKCDVAIFGHEHTAKEAVYDDIRLVDVGSSGCVKDCITYYTIIEIDNNGINIIKKDVKYNRDELVLAVNKIDFPNDVFLVKEFFGIDKEASND